MLPLAGQLLLVELAPVPWPVFSKGWVVPAVIGNIGFVILCFLKSSSHLFPSALCADTGLPFCKTYHSVQVLFLCPANGVDLFKNQSLSLTVAWHFSFSLQGHWCYCVTASPRMDGNRECLTPQISTSLPKLIGSGQEEKPSPLFLGGTQLLCMTG